MIEERREKERERERERERETLKKGYFGKDTFDL